MDFSKFKQKGEELCKKIESVRRDIEELNNSELETLEYEVYTYRWNRLSAKKDKLHEKLAELNSRALDMD